MKSQVKTAYAYLRVGSLQQSNRGESIQAQKEQIKHYCRRSNIGLVDVFIDCPASANNFNRGGFVRMLGRNVIKPVDYIVATRMDRLSRNPYEYMNIKHQLSKLGTQLKFLDEPFEGFLEEILKSMDEFYSAVKRKRGKTT